MFGLLDTKSRKKVAIIEKIFHAKNHSCDQKVLLESLNMTYPTLLSMIDTINEDVLRFGYDSFSIRHSPSNQMYSLQLHENMSVQLLIHAYIRESTKFILLELLLTSSFPNLQALANKLHISYTAIRKDIRELNQMLDENKMYISTRNGVRLEGDELGIRLYYSFLFLTVYGGELWPFSYIQYFEISKLLTNCPEEIYIAGLIDKSMLIHYYIGVHLLRDRQNYLVSQARTFDVPLYAPYSEESRHSVEAFQKDLKHYLPNINGKALCFTTTLLCSVLLAFGSYTSIERVPGFFYSEKTFRENDFLDTVLFIGEKVEQQLSTPFSEHERELLFYSLMCVNYRHFLFNGLSLNLKSVIIGYMDIERNPRKMHKINHLRPLVRALLELEELSALVPFKQAIASDYLIIFEKRIDFSKHTRPIKIALLSVISNETASFDFKSYFSNYYNIIVTNVLERNIDLFISDFSLSPQVLTTLRINQPVVYVNTRWVQSDYEKINVKLAEIATKKLINKRTE
ncbi:helix-turn-helix domain-containing protein [Enterococcus sp. BWR-S5]|uniref:helix-turn-helix domain-containing protein n=1 Tax=Enterococcus sp. BWR-S5 TaxID=2787714 RepID=UPI0019212D08|nr:helix-turn-helix domain-containing protein [Enterococcus sp. BWR-S5]MBL1225873.1 helix-turn-helix domain-containing protein [Enterococcus sp. BWR-S5]